MIRSLLSSVLKPKWLLATFLVITGSLVMVRLGFWQLDRLEKRRAFNNRVLQQVNQAALDLNIALRSGGDEFRTGLSGMEYRQVRVFGEYDFSYEVALRNQVHQDQYGVHLLTPLKIEGSPDWVLVDRGWIPAADFEAGKADANWSQYREQGLVEVVGIIRAAQDKPDFGRISDPTPSVAWERITAWHLANIPQMQKQIPFAVLPVYIQQSPDPTWTDIPYRSQPDLDLTEGPHLGYAIQWFTFAAILFLGYPVFLFREAGDVRSREIVFENPPVTSGKPFND